MPRRSLRSVLATILLLGLLTGARAAPATAAETARQLTELALAHYNLGEYEAALEQFRAAYRAVPSPELLFDIGQCQRLLRRYTEAEHSYRVFLNEMTDEEMISRDAVERLIVQVRQAAAAQPVAIAATVPPGVPAIAAKDEAVRVAVRAPEPPRRAWLRRPTPWALTIGGVLTIAAGAALLGESNAIARQAGAAQRLSDLDRLHATDLGLQRAGWPVLGIGAAATAAGAVVILFAWKGAAK